MDASLTWETYSRRSRLQHSTERPGRVPWPLFTSPGRKSGRSRSATQEGRWATSGFTYPGRQQAVITNGRGRRCRLRLHGRAGSAENGHKPSRAVARYRSATVPAGWKSPQPFPLAPWNAPARSGISPFRSGHSGILLCGYTAVATRARGRQRPSRSPTAQLGRGRQKAACSRWRGVNADLKL